MMVLGVVRRMARRVGKKIDFKQWSSILSLSQEVSTATTFAGASLAFTDPATILRCRGYVSGQMDETKQAGDQIRLIFGLGIASTDAVAAGGGSMPDPGGEPNYPWLWWGSLELESTVAASEEAFGSTMMKVEVDTKAMRKIEPGQSLFWVLQTAGLAGAPVTIVKMYQTRVLIGT